MQYEVETPHQYLEALEEDWRKAKLLRVRELILQSEASISEVIKYKMLGYTFQVQLIFSLNAQKNYVSLYVGDIKKVKQSDQLLEGFNIGKGCIRIKKSNEVSEQNIGQFINNVIQTWRSGGGTDC